MKRSVNLALVTFFLLVLLTVGCIVFLLFAEDRTPKTVKVTGEGDPSVLD